MGKGSRQPRGSYRKNRGSGYLWIFGLLAVAFVALWGWSEWARPNRQISGLETFANEGSEHVALDTVLTYKTNPPTSGRHYPTEIPPGFYTEPQQDGYLVHSLEHGHVVIYYDPEGTPADVVETLKATAAKYTGDWDGVVVTPRQQEEAVILTAWRNMLRLPTWDSQAAERFVDTFRGRGPENPVR